MTISSKLNEKIPDLFYRERDSGFKEYIKIFWGPGGLEHRSVFNDIVCGLTQKGEYFYYEHDNLTCVETKEYFDNVDELISFILNLIKS